MGAAPSCRGFLWVPGALAALIASAPVRAQELPERGFLDEPYRTPRAGEGFRLRVFGMDVPVDAINRRHISAWEAGASITWRPVQDMPVMPFGSLFYWRHETDRDLLRAEVAGLYNDVTWMRRIGHGPMELVTAFTSYTVPFPQAEWVDGATRSAEELYWGYVRPAFGLGMRVPLGPADDNMAAVDVLLEPGVQFFAPSRGADPSFRVPATGLEVRAHVVARWDAMERNLLGLPHQGLAAGADAMAGWRQGWRDWGLHAATPAAAGQDPASVAAYAILATGLPRAGERHRLLLSAHASAGRHLDRFSATRVGGGVRPGGQEYGSSWRPILPGSAVQEFYPSRYLVLVGEYRFEPVFFAYLHAVWSVSVLDRDRALPDGTLRSRDDLFASAGAMVTSGFLFNTRLQLAVHHNTSVIRAGRAGGNEVVLDVNGKF